jgi:hypothetical protein
MGKTRHIKKSRFDDDDTKINKRFKHARNIPGVGMKVINDAYSDDININDEIMVHLNNVKIR